MKFKNKYTGVVLEPIETMAIEQLKASEDYEEVVEKTMKKKEAVKDEIQK